MKRISGLTLAFLGLTLGLTVGFGILVFKNWLISEIVDSIEDEVHAACDCTLAFDKFSISFATLSGKAKNVRILEKGTPKLVFEEITSSFSIAEILEKRVYLNNLTLTRGQADGVGPDSATFRFIDQLTTPLPPEKQTPGRWRVFLNSLYIRDSRLREPLGSSELLGNGVALGVIRNGESFTLSPTISDLRYRSYTEDGRGVESELLLGSAQASLTIEDLRTVFHSLTVSDGASRVSMDATVDTAHNDRMSGSARYSLHSAYIGLPAWLRATVEGHAEVAGTLGSPIFSGAVGTPTDTPLQLLFPNASPISLSQLSGNLSIDINRGDPIITLEQLVGRSGRTELRGTEPLRFSDEGLSAGFDIATPTFSYGPFSIADGKGRIQVRPMGKDTEASFQIEASDIKVQGTSLGPAKLTVLLTSNKVDLTVDTTDPRQGSLHWEGSIDLSAPDPRLTKGELRLTKYRYPLSLPISPERLAPVEVTAALPISGPLNLKGLSGEGVTSIAFPSLPDGMPLSGRTSLKDGILSVALPTSTYHGAATLKVDIGGNGSGTLTANLPRIPLSKLTPHAPCGEVGADLAYSFKIQHPLDGSGALKVADASFGCAPYSLKLPSRVELPIKNGELLVRSLAVSGINSALNLDGEIHLQKGYNLKASGDILLSSFLPFFPGLDDLQGRLTCNVALRGPFTTPAVTGKASLTGGEFGLDNPDIEGRAITGSFILDTDLIRIQSLTGVVNDGKVSVDGTILPFDFPASQVKVALSEVTIEPMADATITFSGGLTLRKGESMRQRLGGSIVVDSAEISKDFDLNKILLSTISGYFLPTRIQHQAKTERSSLDLDIAIDAPRNIFVFTPFFSAELNTHLSVQGSASDPSVSGAMQVLSGWVGLKDNRFDITSGSLVFRPGSLTPNLELVSEGSLRTPTGENILVILEATGPLTSPRITLSSDRGLSHEQLLTLLTSSRSLTGRTIANRAGTQFGSDQRFLLSPDSFSSFGAFLHSLTSLDTLSFEPMYNPFTGLIEPAVVGKKNITPRFRLLGESLFSTVGNSRAGAVYDLSRSLSVNAFMQTVSTQRNLILSSDLTYTILAGKTSFIDFDIEGLSHIQGDDLLAGSRLSESSRIRNDLDSLSTVRRDIANYLRDQGFLAASVEVTCIEGAPYCRKLFVRVSEGPQVTIERLSFLGDSLPAPILKTIERTARVGETATTKLLQEIERSGIVALRNEGYIAARLTLKYEQGSSPDKVVLSLSSDIRKPISFTFSGNRKFSEEELLNSIDLFTRKRPFGNNTINLLVKNIERMYQEEGYLFARVSYTVDSSNPARTNYHVTIVEEGKVKVATLTITGNDHVPLSSIKAVMQEIGYGEQVQLLSPSVAVPDQLDSLRDILISVFQQEGYPKVDVTYSFVQREDSLALDVHYAVNEGEPVRIATVAVQGWPVGINPPPAPETPASLPRMNRYVQQAINLLRGEAFFFPGVTVAPSSDYHAATITIDPGQRTFISSIIYDGLQEIKEEALRTYVSIKAGDPFRSDTVNETKRALLRSGLFSRVEVVAQDGALDSPEEIIVIRLVERPLRTLEVGGGANSEFGLHVFGEAVDKSLFSDGRTLALRLDTYFDKARIDASNSSNIGQGFASLRYTDPSFLATTYSLTEDLRFQRQDLTTQEYDLDRVSLASYLFRQYESATSLSFGHTILSERLQNVAPGAIISDLDTGTVRLSFISGLLKVDGRDDPLLPRSGYTFTIEPKLALAELGSEGNFGSVLSQATGIVPLSVISPRFSLGLASGAGISRAFDGTTEVPITQRFYLGGRTTVRGYRENSLGPRSSEETGRAVIGGDVLLMGKSQLQYLLTDSLSTHIFFDAGNVYLHDRDPSYGALRYSTGAGFQYRSPIGPIGFDVGHPLNKKDYEPSIRVHFSVGSTF